MIDLQKFCDADTVLYNRPSTATPWSAGENTFATNRHLIIRVPRRDDVAERKNAPALTELSQWFFKEPEKWYPIPSVNPKMQPCGECNGKGKHKHRGTFITCEDCEGKGEIQRHLGIDVGPAKFSDVYLSWLAELPGVEIGPFEPFDPARFRFQGGDGLLMPEGL